MNTGNPMTLESRLAVAAIGVLGIILILWLLRRKHINEGVFYIWLAVFGGIIIVGTSHQIQISLTRFIGAYDPVSTMLLLSLGFLFGAALVYSVMITGLNTKVREITSFIAELRLDVDDLLITESRLNKEPGEKGPETARRAGSS